MYVYNDADETCMHSNRTFAKNYWAGYSAVEPQIGTAFANIYGKEKILSYGASYEAVHLVWCFVCACVYVDSHV